MPITHSTVVSNPNNPNDAVSSNAWNADHTYSIEWTSLLGAPFVTVTPNGPKDGGDFGPNSPYNSPIGSPPINGLSKTGGLNEAGQYIIEQNYVVNTIYMIGQNTIAATEQIIIPTTATSGTAINWFGTSGATVLEQNYVDASHPFIVMSASAGLCTLTSGLTSGVNNYTSLSVTATTNTTTIPASTTLLIGTSWGSWQAVETSAPITAGSTMISVNSFTANANYVIGQPVGNNTLGKLNAHCLVHWAGFLVQPGAAITTTGQMLACLGPFWMMSGEQGYSALFENISIDSQKNAQFGWYGGNAIYYVNPSSSGLAPSSAGGGDDYVVMGFRCVNGMQTNLSQLNTMTTSGSSLSQYPTYVGASFGDFSPQGSGAQVIGGNIGSVIIDAQDARFSHTDINNPLIDIRSTSSTGANHCCMLENTYFDSSGQGVGYPVYYYAPYNPCVLCSLIVNGGNWTVNSMYNYYGWIEGEPTYGQNGTLVFANFNGTRFNNNANVSIPVSIFGNSTTSQIAQYGITELSGAPVLFDNTQTVYQYLTQTLYVGTPPSGIYSNGTLLSPHRELVNAWINSGTAFNTITSTTVRSDGLGFVFVPRVTGTITIMIWGVAYNNTANDGINVQIYTGTGSPPAHNGSLAGATAQGSAQTFTMGATPAGVPFQLVVTDVSGFNTGTQYYVDIGLFAITGGAAQLKTALLVRVLEQE